MDFISNQNHYSHLNWTSLVRTGLGISFKTIVMAKDPRLLIFSRGIHRGENSIDIDHIQQYCNIMISNWYQLNQLNDATNAPYIILTKDELLINSQKRDVVLKDCLACNV